MRDYARLVVFVFAVAAFAVIFLLWKKNERQTAEKTLREVYQAEIVISEDNISVGCDSDRLKDLTEFTALLNKFTTPTVLDLTGCNNLESFRGAEGLTALQSIIAIDCPKLKSLEGISGLPELNEVILTDSAAVEDFSGLRDLPELSTIDASGCLALKEIPLQNLPNLTNLYVSRCRELTSVDLSNCSKLEQFYADGCAKMTSIVGLETLGQLTDLDVSNCSALETISGLDALKNLVVLDIRNVELKDFSEIGKMSELRIFRLGGQSSLKDLSVFSGMSGLTELHVEACANLESIENLPTGLTNYLGFTYCPKLTSIKGLGNSPGLQQLDLTGCETLTDVSDLSKMKELIQLNLTKCEQVTDINVIKDLENMGIVLLGGSGVIPASIKELKREMRGTIFDFLLADQQ